MTTRQRKPKSRHWTTALFPQAKKAAKRLTSDMRKGPQRSFPMEGQQPKRKPKRGRKRLDEGNLLIDPGMVIVPENPRIDGEMERPARG